MEFKGLGFFLVWVPKSYLTLSILIILLPLAESAFFELSDGQ